MDSETQDLVVAGNLVTSDGTKMAFMYYLPRSCSDMKWHVLLSSDELFYSLTLSSAASAIYGIVYYDSNYYFMKTSTEY